MKNSKKLLKLVFHSDSGHGWLAVKVKLIKELGIEQQISTCSYIRGKTVYLEEDCDAPLFINKCKEMDIPLFIIESNYYPNRQPIRSYNKYTFLEII